MYLYILLLNILITCSTYSADLKNNLLQICTLPHEIQNIISTSCVLSINEPEYDKSIHFNELPLGPIKQRQHVDTRNDFYVQHQHLLVALYFWNTDFMYDLVAFEIGRFRKKPNLIFSIDTDTWADELVCIHYIKRTQPNKTENFKKKFQETLLKFTGQHYKLFLPIQKTNYAEPSIFFDYTKPELLINPYPHYTTQETSTKPLSSSNECATIYRSINDGPPYVTCKCYTTECSIIKNNNSSYGEDYIVSIWFDNLETTRKNCFWDTQENWIHVFNTKKKNLEHFPILPKSNTIEPFDRFFIEALCGFAKDKKNYPYKSFWKNKSYSFFKYPVLSPAWRLCKRLHETNFTDENKKKINHIIQSSITIPTMGYQFLRSISSLFPPLMFTIPYYGIHYFLPHWYLTNYILAGTLWLISKVIRKVFSANMEYFATSDGVRKKLDII